MLTNKCGSKQGAVTKFIRSPRTAISFFRQIEKKLRGVVCCVKKNKKKSTEGYKIILI